MFVKLDTNEWINLNAMERVWVNLDGRCQMSAPDGTQYRVDRVEAYTEADIVKEIQRAMTIKRKAAEE
jgi:hypothetical protein